MIWVGSLWGRVQKYQEKPVHWFVDLCVVAVVYGVVLVAVGFAAAHHAFATLVVLSILLAVAGVAVNIVMGGIEKTGLRPALKPILLSLMVEVGLVVVFIQHFQLFGVRGFAGLSLIMVGAGQLASEFREAKSFRWPLTLVLVAHIAVALICSLFFGLGGVSLLLAGVVFAVPAVSFGTEVVLDLLSRKQWDSGFVWKRVGPVSAILLLAGAALLWSVGPPVVPIAAVLALVLICMVASNTEYDLMFVLVVVALIWSQVPSPGGPDLHARTGPAIVAFGDSYISGEGAKSYFDGTNTRIPAVYDECRRAPTSYPVLVAKKLGVGLDDEACSGAKVANLTDSGQYVGENPPGMRAVLPGGGQPSLLGQLDMFAQRGPPVADVRLVLVSIGGNDSGFGSVIAACIAPGDCSERGQRWLDALPALGAKLNVLYARLHAIFGDRVLVVPYPIPIRERACSVLTSTFPDNEHLFLNGFTRQLDHVIHTAATANGLHYLDSMEDAFATRSVRICDAPAAEAAVNYIALNPVGGQVDPRAWLHNSMHPNASGHRIMAGEIETWIEKNPMPAAAADTPSPAPIFSLADVMGEAAGNHPGPVAARISSAPPTVKNSCRDKSRASSCLQNDGDWAFLQMRHAFLSHLVAFLFIVGGAWGLWVCALHRRHRQRIADRRVPPGAKNLSDVAAGKFKG